MSLEALYNQAAANTYVGKIRTRQAADAPDNQTLVNFLDGQAKGRFRAGVVPSNDIFQAEFTRNKEGTYLSSGAQGIARNSTQTYTRWTDKSFKLAFDGEGPSQLINGFYTNQFRPGYAEASGMIKRVHTYTPTPGKKFVDLNTSARARSISSPSGAPTF